ncbi:MAG: aminotransferase class V-fold PLP-dependent enzyme [Gemmatimonadaceae bacterium]|nr:aminotransferase class V-fold PLP-dependent enzyme [Gemmatimonadaceae bacterium]
MTHPDDALLRFRDRFPILARSTYLVSNSLGAMPASTAGRLAEYAEAWNTLGVKAWAERWWQLPVEVGNIVAPLLGAPAGSVAMVPTVTQAQAMVVSALNYTAERDEIVMTALDFPSVRYVTDELAPRLGARVTVVPGDDGIGIDAQRVVDAITPRTKLVAISHVLFKSAFIMDVAPIIAKAHAVGALVALDAYHAVGVIPVDVIALGADFYMGGVLKWLCGGPGGCFLWVSPEQSATLRPVLTGWQAHQRPFAFEPTLQPADGAWRWLGGTPTVPALYAAMDGPAIIAEAGLESIRARSQRQTARLIAYADERGFAVHAPRDPARRGGTVAFDVPNGPAVAQALLSRDIVIDYRPGAGIRVAPHFYTTDGELDAFRQALDDILATRAWERFSASRPVVT